MIIFMTKLIKDHMKPRTLFSCNGYNHKSPPYHRVVEDNYLELYKDQKDNDVYYIDYGKIAIISSFAVLEIILDVEIVHEMKYVKLISMYVITSNVHQALCELVNDM